MSKKVGVIGGLGTDTAAQFYVECERLWHDSGQPNHIPLVLENIQSPFALEQSLVDSMDRADELRSFLCTAAKNLETAGASFIVIPCNTAHIHLNAVRAAVKIPVISITESVAKKMKSIGFKATAILGTTVTKQSGIYDRDCRVVGIDTLFPSTDDQHKVERIIQRALSWKNDQTDTIKLRTVIQRMRHAGADCVVLACTDLQLCMPKQLPTHVIDSMKTLAEATVECMLQFPEYV